MSEEPRKAYELNASGDFYVEDGMCITCGAPEAAAPSLVTFYVDPDGSNRNTHCYFRRQPTSSAEVEQAIQAVHLACCTAVRYRGSDRAILQRLAALGASESCDAPSARTSPLTSPSLATVNKPLEPAGMNALALPNAHCAGRSAPSR